MGCTGTELFCEDFEDDTVGVAPGAPWLALDDYCADQFTTEITTELAHAGSKAFKATKSRAANCRSSAPFAEVDDFWLRAFIYWDPSVDFNALEVLAIDLTGPTQLKSDDPALRFGTRMKTPCEASGGPQITITGLAGGEQTGCSGNVQEPKGEWFCFEAHVDQASELKVKTYIDGQGFTYESSGKAPSETIETPAGTPLVTKVNHVRLGIFSTPSPVTGSVYIDDIAIATTRLGCGG